MTGGPDSAGRVGRTRAGGVDGDHHRAADPGPARPAPVVVVVGAGIAGLAAAWELADAGVRVDVLEADAMVGGKLRQAVVAGVPVDVGPDAFLARRPEARALCEELGLADDLVAPGVSGADIWARGRLRHLPDGLVLGVPTRLGPLARSGIVGPLGLLRAATDLVARHPVADAPPPTFDGHPPAPTGRDHSVAELVAPRLGRAVTDLLVDPLVGGIHAGPIAAMSAEAVFPGLLAAAATPGSLMRALRAGAGAGPTTGGAAPAGPIFLTVRGGMGRLADRLARELEARGARLRTSCPVTAVVGGGGTGGRWRVDTAAGAVDADAVVLALPAPAAAEVLVGGMPASPGDGVSPAAAVRSLARFLGGVDYGGVAVVTLAFRPEGPAARWRRARGTGFLVPVGQGLLTTGCTWLSAKWPELSPDGPVLVRLSAGRYGDRRALDLADDALVRRLLSELRALAGDVDDPLDTVVTRWQAAFPQYRVGQRQWAAGVAEAAAAVPGLAVAGAAYDGVGVPACIATGRRAARQVLAHLGAAAHR